MSQVRYLVSNNRVTGMELLDDQGNVIHQVTGNFPPGQKYSIINNQITWVADLVLDSSTASNKIVGAP